MKTTKEVDLGEYKVIIDYDDSTGGLKVTIFDELEEEIEHIEIISDESGDNIDPTLN